jgi:hypothetical protein
LPRCGSPWITPKRLNGTHQAVNIALANRIAHGERVVLVLEQAAAFEPVEREQPAG